ncbi:MAG: hypothetical protein ACTSUE_11755 [Promethearchaeota archaeon]
MDESMGGFSACQQVYKHPEARNVIVHEFAALKLKAISRYMQTTGFILSTLSAFATVFVIQTSGILNILLEDINPDLVLGLAILFTVVYVCLTGLACYYLTPGTKPPTNNQHSPKRYSDGDEGFGTVESYESQEFPKTPDTPTRSFV